MGRSMASNGRQYAAGGQARYLNPPMTEPALRSKVSLRPDHPALTQGRSIHQHHVFHAADRDRVLIEGINNAKTGNLIMVGPWAGFRQYNLSLEERATCPRSCAVWAECFGNRSVMTSRFHYDAGLMSALEQELAQLQRKHSHGFAVRLHVLGDFPEVAYVAQWARWLKKYLALHVWGYTANGTDTPIGAAINLANRARPDRWRVRFSVPEWAAPGPMQVTTTWHKPDTTAFDPETSSMVCPQEIGKTPHCATCGICWKPELSHVRVVFYGHGGRGGRASTTKSVTRPTAADVTLPHPTPGRPRSVYAPVAKRDPALDTMVAQAVARGAVTRLPALKAR